jgi:hypothetical protein
VVSDYPVPFVPGLPSPGGVTDLVNAATAALDAQIAAAAGAAGPSVTLATVQWAYLGHQVGDADPWLGADPTNALTFLHPTAAGQMVYRDAILAALPS